MSDDHGSEHGPKSFDSGDFVEQHSTVIRCDHANGNLAGNGAARPAISHAPANGGPLLERVLVLTDYYLPGFKAGGPVRSLAALVENVGREAEFLVATRDRDLAETSSYPGTKPGEWMRVGMAQCRYLSPSELSPREMARLIASTPHDTLYLNSLFSVRFGVTPLLLRRFRLIPRNRTIIAPRGELDPGALRFKRLRKRVYLRAARFMGIGAGLIWQATSSRERDQIEAWFGTKLSIVLAPNVSPPRRGESRAMRSPKASGRLRMVFLSRIAPKKNLYGALQMLSQLPVPVSLDIYGPIEDGRYWERCQRLIRCLPTDVLVRYRGIARPEEVDSLLRRYDLFFLPTRGENHGHVILEALNAGCPVLVSDETPWRDLEKDHAGWDVPLRDVERFRAIIQRCVEMPAPEHARMSLGAQAFARRVESRNAAFAASTSRLFCAAGKRP